MALHSKWTSGNLEFYDGTNSVATISASGLGIVATNVYLGSTGYALGTTSGVSFTGGGGPIIGITVVNGQVTAITT